MSEFEWSSILSKISELQMFAGKVEQIAEAAMADMKSQYFVINNLNLEDCSDSDSDCESSLSEYVFEDIIEDLSTYMESLTDLALSLDHPAADHVFVEEVNKSLIDEFSTVSEPARPFFLIIRDRFPSLDAGIVKKLGEANWQRRERLRMKLASAPDMAEVSSTGDDDNSSIGDTIVDPRRQAAEDQETIVSTVRSSISLTRTFQSATIESQFSEPSIFDNMSISIPATRRVRPAESVTSFATSVAEGVGHGQRRVPNLPDDHGYGSTFQCKICGEILAGIRHRADWKYVCSLLRVVVANKPEENMSTTTLNPTYVFSPIAILDCILFIHGENGKTTSSRSTVWVQSGAVTCAKISSKRRSSFAGTSMSLTAMTSRRPKWKNSFLYQSA
jgi:hypothetical protein